MHGVLGPCVDVPGRTGPRSGAAAAGSRRTVAMGQCCPARAAGLPGQRGPLPRARCGVIGHLRDHGPKIIGPSTARRRGSAKPRYSGQCETTNEGARLWRNPPAQRDRRPHSRPRRLRLAAGRAGDCWLASAHCLWAHGFSVAARRCSPGWKASWRFVCIRSETTARRSRWGPSSSYCCLSCGWAAAPHSGGEVRNVDGNGHGGMRGAERDGGPHVSRRCTGPLSCKLPTACRVVFRTRPARDARR